MVDQKVRRNTWATDAAPVARLVYGVTVEEGLGLLKTASVHCVVTSPPYWGLRDYSGGSEELGRESTVGEYVDRLVAVFRGVKRVLRTDGTVWLNLGDSHVTRHDPVAGLKPKDVAGVPWRVAQALQRDGWYLRAVVPWLKRNCMPESCVDRPSVGVESVFLLAHPDSGGSYFYDIYGSRVPLSRGTDIRLNQKSFSKQTGGEKDYSGGTNVNRSARRGVENLKARVDAGDTGRQRRCADWYFESLTNIVAGGQGLVVGEDGEPLGLVVNPVSYAGVHAATYPPKLVEPMVLCSTSGHGVCSACGGQWRHEVERAGVRAGVEELDSGKSGLRVKRAGWRKAPGPAVRVDEWVPSCGCGAEPGRAVVLDPFSGSGTTGEVALRLGRMYVGIDLNEDYLPMAEARIRGDEPPAPLAVAEDDGGDTVVGLFGE